jgi:hypothetical protein
MRAIIINPPDLRIRLRSGAPQGEFANPPGKKEKRPKIEPHPEHLFFSKSVVCVIPKGQSA